MSERLVHLVREPSGEPQGALVLLHGRGADERDLVPLLDVLDPDRRLVGLTPGAPLHLPPGGRHWYVVPRVGYPDPPTFHASYAALTSLLDDWLRERGIDWSQTVIGGFSMGCVMSYATALGPGRPAPAGILAISGFIPTVEGWEPRLDERGDLPVLISHGSRDPVISVEFARDARERLRSAGLAVEYHEHGGGHQLDPQSLPRMTEWVTGLTR
ncbi:MAG TPA: phospholipase [Solirubrobacteraceae bacterium]|nr:phospholipase [Solirubrobacteraceae bacterium]